MPLEKLTSLEGLLEKYQNEPALTLAIERYTRPTEDNFWKWREMYRVYKTEKTKPAFDLDETIDDNHQLFIWPDDPKFVGYFESEDKGKRDVPTQIRVGKYLAKFYGQHYDNEKIKTLVSDHLFLHSPPELKFAEDDEELIEHIYENGPRSCMVRARGYVPNERNHPVRAYASPDIGLAYIEKGDRFTARTVYNRKTKTYARIYGDATMLTSMLKEQGFRAKDDALLNCRLLRISWDGKDQNIVLMPYLDGAATRIMNDPDNPREFLKITNNGDYPSGSVTGGRISVKAWNWCKCSHCNADTTTDTVTPAYGHPRGICPTCAETHFMLATGPEKTQILAKRTTIIAIGTLLYVDQKTADALHGKTVFAEDIGNIPEKNTVKLHNGKQGAKHLTVEATAVPDIAANRGDATRVYAHTMNDNGQDWSVDPFAEERGGLRYRFVPHQPAKKRNLDLMPTAVKVADVVLPHLVPYLPDNHEITEQDLANALTRVYKTTWIPGHDPFLTTLLDLYYQLYGEYPAEKEIKDSNDADLRTELTAAIAA